MNHNLPPMTAPARGRDQFGETPRPPFHSQIQTASDMLSWTALKLEEIPVHRGHAGEDAQTLDRFGLEHRDIEVPGYNGHLGKAGVWRRPGDAETGPGFIFIHGGGMVLGDRFLDVSVVLPWVQQHGGTLVSIEYRLAPEFPAPVPVEDAYAAASWVVEHAGELGFDPERVVLAGMSGGGGIAAGVALLARDRRGPSFEGVWLNCPMIDDRNDTVSARQYEDLGLWATRSNKVCWQAVLGDAVGTDDVSPYDAAARAPWLGGLAPILITVGSAEPFRDEDVAFASAIWRDGGDCELHVIPGGTHAYTLFAANSSIGEIHEAAVARWIARIVEPDDPNGSRHLIENFAAATPADNAPPATPQPASNSA
ncbi:alpha/beta hydrolase [Arthrobacter sp. B2a2-09]|uniref:alpha/beta hydrolase n=1 Tax=Arthrobacter sp. B2a2-09 TaxID=2952822 RepID=UPI0022CD2919|nr:alpha/beta hydrolase [Arthrobacter sp. B2a2-09]MCZ9881642.1 alpha/beta hydrolase [Arthrobacter sp. B2a2-09]